MAFTGMDIDAVKGLARQMGTDAGEIRRITQKLTGQLGSTSWVGADKDRFQSDWDTRYAKLLGDVATALDDAAEAANRNANEQETASR